MKRIGYSCMMVWFAIACNRLTETSSDIILPNDVDYLNFLQTHPGALDTFIYVSEVIWMEQETDLTLSLGSDDGFALRALAEWRFDHDSPNRARCTHAQSARQFRTHDHRTGA